LSTSSIFKQYFAHTTCNIKEGFVVSKRTETLVASVKDQWARTWSMWEEMIQSIPDEEWARGEIDYLIPARHLIHVTVGEDVFSADTPLDESVESKWFGVPAWETAASDLPSGLEAKFCNELALACY